MHVAVLVYQFGVRHALGADLPLLPVPPRLSDKNPDESGRGDVQLPEGVLHQDEDQPAQPLVLNEGLHLDCILQLGVRHYQFDPGQGEGQECGERLQHYHDQRLHRRVVLAHEQNVQLFDMDVAHHAHFLESLGHHDHGRKSHSENEIKWKEGRLAR